MEDIVVFGAGGHAKVVLDIIEKAQLYSVKYIYVLDPDGKDEFFGYPLACQADLVNLGIFKGLVAIGDNWRRSQVVKAVIDMCPNFEFVSAIHPSAQIGREVEIVPGAVIMAGAVINSGTELEGYTIVNTAASVDHDCRVKKFASINPGAVLGGGVRIGAFSAIGIGATVLQGVSVGEHTVVGAGSVVTRLIPDHVVAYGTPCKVMKHREEGPYLSNKS